MGLLAGRSRLVLPRFDLYSLLPFLIAAAVTGCEQSTKVRRPAGLMYVSGSGQSGIVGQPLPSPFVVKVVDLDGAGIPGETVTWKVTGGGGRVSADTGVAITRTDQAGQTMVTLTLGSTAGINTVSATLSWYTEEFAPVGFTATGLAGAARRARIRSAGE
jgi:hypothetical protein